MSFRKGGLVLATILCHCTAIGAFVHGLSAETQDSSCGKKGKAQEHSLLQKQLKGTLHSKAVAGLGSKTRMQMAVNKSTSMTSSSAEPCGHPHRVVCMKDVNHINEAWVQVRSTTSLANCLSLCMKEANCVVAVFNKYKHAISNRILR